MCCALRRLYTAYVAVILDWHCMEDDFSMSFILCQKHFHHLRSPPPKTTEFQIRYFDFRFRSRGAIDDFSAYEFSYVGVTLTFHLVLVDATVDCCPRACINFMDFFWDNIKTFAFIKYAIVCVPLDTQYFISSPLSFRYWRLEDA